jgi:hypothetical protein
MPTHNTNINITENVAPSLDISIEKQWVVENTTTTTLGIEAGYNTYPIMGYIYQPTDISGQQVQVQSDLNDYYWEVDTSNTLTEVYWSPDSLSSDRTNDLYQPYRLK